MRYTLRQLQVFLAVAHSQNVTKAAEQLALSQSATSTALKELEQHFEIQLFDRIGKRLQLNSLGSQLRPKVESLLDQAKELEAGFYGKPLEGEISIGATLTIGNYLAVNLMNIYQQQYPQAQVKLQIANTQTIVNKLINFDIDVGLIEGEAVHPKLEVAHWRDDELIVFCSPENPLAKYRTVKDKALVLANWILREPGSGTRQGFDRVMHDLLKDINVAMELQHTEAIKRAVDLNMGIACLSKASLDDDFERGRFVPINIPERNFIRAFYLVYHKDKYQTALIKNWLKLCKADCSLNKRSSDL
ncbi:LysR family transcriptional regulator [bacterium]|nr:LysR family transcriptional regulator [bacterium]